MKVLVATPKFRYDTFAPDTPAFRSAELIFCDRRGTEADWLAAAGDAEAIFVSPITPIRGSLISRMPNLRLIHSEGVGFDLIDLETARKRGIYVCNNAGCNAGPVAEQAVMMMTMLLRRTLWGHRMVLEGRQGEAVPALERNVPEDLASSTVGLVGFGAIGRAAAERLRANGSKLCYWSRHRRDAATEAAFDMEYLSLYELAERSHIVSLHIPANRETEGLIGRDFFSHMRPGSYLVNTARGGLIDNDALGEALRSGRLAGAAFDNYVPEPVPADHPLVLLAREFPDRILLCPHQAGITQTAFRNVYRMLFENLGELMAGRRPQRIINGL